VARRYSYWLGGKDHFGADREAGDKVAAAYPGIGVAVAENRRFLRRAVTYLARDAGVRQFLDIGAGLPTGDDTHQIAQAIHPDARVVYVDNDPVVLSHTRALHTSAPDGVIVHIDADLREPEKILADPDLRSALDWTQPIGLLLVAVLHFIPDDDRPHEVVASFARGLPEGSWLVISHATYDHFTDETIAALAATGPFYPRSREDFVRFVDGMDVVPPGWTNLSRWRDEDEEEPRPLETEVAAYAAVAQVRAQREGEM
jgi:SAM-dependent methyltransferase